ncbi:MAG: CehA/McbA family metallohydrolase [Solimonas sp.]
MRTMAWGGVVAAIAAALVLASCGGGNHDQGSTTRYRLTVAIADGGGSVASAPAGISCGTQCEASFDAGTAVTLTATPQAGKVFDGFEGACSGLSCTVTLNADTTVTARFSTPVSKACDDDADAPTQPLQHYHGLIHAHTSYSDGDIRSTPHDVFQAGHDNHLDFAAVTDHSDTLNGLLYLSVGSDCFKSIGGLLTCLIPQAGDFRKWPVTRQEAEADRSDDFLPIRGFEWTSDRFGHINVLFGANFTNAKLDGGYTGSMDPFWSWLPRAPGPEATAGVTGLGGGADSVAIFNHPGDKCLSDDDAGCNWNGFTYVPAVDAQMVGIELFNSGTSGDRPDAGRKNRYADFYMQALDKGWHVGAVGAEDMHDTTWALPSHPKTVILAETLDDAGLKKAMQARRMYALLGRIDGEDLTITLDAEGHAMGSRLACTAGKTVPLRVKVTLADGRPFGGIVRLYDHADPAAPLADGGPGKPLAETTGDTLNYELPVAAEGEHWFFVRVDNAAGQSLAYTSPVWIRAR